MGTISAETIRTFFLSSIFISYVLLTGCSPQGSKSHWTLVEENDYFSSALMGNSDNSYTQGLKITQATQLDAIESETISIGQNIYTPAAKHVSELIEDDRPYAGYLYTEYGRVFTFENFQDTLALQLGIIGPAALGEETQSGFHKLLGQSAFDGWDNQLENEPTINILGTRTYRLGLYRSGTYGIEFLPGGQGELGTVRTGAGFTASLRFGSLGKDFLPQVISPRLATASSGDDSRAFPTAYLFAGVTGRAVARNAFLDGNLTQDSHRVTREPFVGEYFFGLAGSFRGYELGLRITHITDEWKEKESSHNFGTVTLGFDF